MDTAQLTFILNTLHLETGVQNAKYIPHVYKRVFLKQSNHGHKKLFSNYLLEANRQIEMTYIFFNVMTNLLKQSSLGGGGGDSSEWSFNSVVINTMEKYSLVNHFHDYLISIINGNKIIKLPGACDLPVKIFMGLAMEILREMIPMPSSFDPIVTDYDVIVQSSANGIDNIEIRPTTDEEIIDKDIASMFMDEMQEYTDAMKAKKEEEDNADTIIFKAGGNTIRMRSLGSTSPINTTSIDSEKHSSSMPELTGYKLNINNDDDDDEEEDALSIDVELEEVVAPAVVEEEEEEDYDYDNDDGYYDEMDEQQQQPDADDEKEDDEKVDISGAVAADAADDDDDDDDSTEVKAEGSAEATSAIDNMISKFVYKPYTAADLASFSFGSLQ